MGDSLVCVSGHTSTHAYSTSIQSFDSLLTRPTLTRSLWTDRMLLCVCVPCVDLVCGGRFMSKYLSTVCKSAYIFVWWFAECVCMLSYLSHVSLYPCLCAYVWFCWLFSLWPVCLIITHAFTTVEIITDTIFIAGFWFRHEYSVKFNHLN